MHHKINFFFSSRRRHTRYWRDWSSDVCSSDLAARVELVTFSTTQAMNALLEGDVAPVGVVGIGAQPDLGRARRRTRVGNVKLAPGRVLRTVHEFLDVTGGLGEADIEAALDRVEHAGCLSVAVSGAFGSGRAGARGRHGGARARARRAGVRGA